MARKPKAKAETTAREIYEQSDALVITRAVSAVLSQGGAVMFGQTRDQEKLIVTVYLDGDQDKEYCDDPKDLEEFLGAYQI